VSAAISLTHLQRLEAESIHIMREVVSESDKPVMLYSIGKDSAVMLHLARKAFFPAFPPFPLLHVDTTWKFRAMYEFRDRMARESGMQLLVHQNPEARKLGINPFDHGSSLHTDLWKTQGLKQALDLHQFDVAFGGARRNGPSYGICTTPVKPVARASGCFPSPTGPNSTSGNTFIWRTSPSYRCICRRRVQRSNGTDCC
jgi:3'-phosphoadenosine 5'-phosphosulfate sulfotransferase (PAPS reductase)/FAD synthetase